MTDSQDVSITFRDRIGAIRRGIRSDRPLHEFYGDYIDNLRAVRIMEAMNDE